ncbi:glutamine-hydrolyzing GMP synthase [Candidatus Bipolaricaulota bacterium]|nr:glutamine-hydrolyzing GMP synthase [Candidatus Bipolaricaulota bacterium]
MSSKTDAIVVVDFGGQYAHLIGRRIREFNVYSEIVPYDVFSDEIVGLREKFQVKGIILSGGPSSVYREGALEKVNQIFELGLPVLGICYGHQLIAHVAGGRVRAATKKEYGITVATIDRPIGVLKGLGKREKVWMSHGDTVYRVPPDYLVLAHTENSPVAALKHREKPIFGLQWHPEVAHTENGEKMLRNFVFEVCGCQPNWMMGDFVKNSIREIREATQGKKCIIALSGGIDSSVATALAARALGRRLTAVFVDHGFMREGEPEFVRKTFGRMGINFISVDARKRFLMKLRGVTDPEEKRKIIGREFIKVFEEVAKKVGADYLIQGTIYPDRIESGFRRRSEKIKTHHNVAGLPTKIEFKGIIEPLRDLYKDEVRKVAERLKLPQEIIRRQPFPGPGLAVRITGEITPEKIRIIKTADRIVREEIERSGLKDGLWQYFAVLTDTKSTGVKGDARAYGYTVAVRAVESREAMTASFAKIPYEVLERISTRITNETPAVTRVVYDITHKPPATIEWE